MADCIWYGTTDTDYGTSANWSAAPGAGDHVRLTPLYNNAIAGSDQSGTAIGDFVVEDGFASTLGSKTANLKLDPNFFLYAGTGQAFIDLHSAAITAEISKTATAGTGEHGLYLIASALTELSITSGNVGVAAVHNTTATVTTANINGGRATFGEGTTLATLNVYGGTVIIRCPVTTVNVFSGQVTLEEQAAITTLNISGGGGVTYNSTGTIATANLTGGGFLDCTEVGLARTISTLKIDQGSIRYDPDRVTISARSDPSNPVSVSVSRAY